MPRRVLVPSLRRHAPSSQRGMIPALADVATDCHTACMPRTARATPGGIAYHVLNRGNRRAQVFHSDRDYHGFVRLLAMAALRFPIRLLAFCLMPNHFHLAVCGASAWVTPTPPPA